jgi:hypothetical protein
MVTGCTRAKTTVPTIHQAASNLEMMKVLVPNEVAATYDYYAPRVFLVRAHCPKRALVLTEREPRIVGEHIHPNLGRAKVAFVCHIKEPNTFYALHPNSTEYVSVLQLCKRSVQQSVIVHGQSDQGNLREILQRTDFLPVAALEHPSTEVLEDENCFYIVTSL